MTYEDQFICLCSQLSPSKDDVKSLHQLVSFDLDWPYIVDTASYHKVTPLVYNSIGKVSAPDIPDWFRQSLKKSCLFTIARNLAHYSTLVFVLELFDKNNVQSIVFKGLALAADIYGQIGMRTFGDLDMLVPRQDLRKAILLLQREGFKTDIDLNLEQYKKLVAKSHHAVLVKDRAIIELHWELSGRYISQGIQFKDVAGRGIDIDIEGRDVRSLGPEDLLVYLCLHGCRSYWLQLDMACGVNELIRKKKNLDWEQVFHIAREQGAEKMVVHGLQLVEHFWSVGLPAPVAKKTKKEMGVQKATNWVADRMFDVSKKGVQPRYLEGVKYHYLIMDRFGDWFRYALRPLINPTHSDWQWLKLSAPLSNLYYLLRPIRLAWKYLRKIFR